jgi:glycosyltransferase involved in cell wall biosynthesis
MWILMTDLSIVLPYYLNPSMLSLQFANWASWPEAIKDRVEIVIVDDGSPEGHAIDVLRPEGLPKLSIYRVLEDRPWHQHAARNLGADVAKGEWLLLTDMDHVLKQDAAEALLKRINLGKLDRKAIYTLARVEADTGLPTMKDGREKPHPNSFVVTKETFWHIGGYDESFVGVYGTDSLFRSRAYSRAIHQHLDKVPLTRYWRDLVPDASTTTLPRKEGRWLGARKEILMGKIARGEENVVKVLQFPWEQQL